VVEAVVSTLLAAVFLPVVGVHLSPAALVGAGLLGGSLLAQYTLFDAINAYGRTDWAAALDAVGSVAQIVLVLVLAARGVQDVAAYLTALTVANGLQVGLELVSLRVMGISIRPRYRREAWRLLLRSGLPGAGLSLAQMLTFKVDRYLVGLFLTPTAVGLYSVAAAVPEMLRVPCVALSNSFFYRIASGAARPADFAALRRAFILGAAVLAAIAAIAAPFGVRVVFGKDYLGAVGSLRVLLLAEVGVSVFQLDGF
jgi:O-antigen/teichoic acid export membrane protein